MGEPAALGANDYAELLELARDAIARVTNDEGVPSDVFDRDEQLAEGQLLRLCQLVVAQHDMIEYRDETIAALAKPDDERPF